ncbi:MAG: diacylglycerol kinase family protein [Bacilli bacterium]|jgi:diacylglycerol kinase|nr:diacylglycerol kinase family protein [Bacilli bacterium]
MLGKKKFQKEQKRLRNSFKHAFEGIGACFQSEQNMKIHVAILCLVVLGGVFFQITTNEWLICMILFGLVLSAELMNTAIETTIDLCMPNIHPKAKLAKDTAAGAVLVLAMISAMIGFLIFIPKLIDQLETLF